MANGSVENVFLIIIIRNYRQLKLHRQLFKSIIAVIWHFHIDVSINQSQIEYVYDRDAFRIGRFDVDSGKHQSRDSVAIVEQRNILGGSQVCKLAATNNKRIEYSQPECW